MGPRASVSGAFDACGHYRTRRPIVRTPRDAAGGIARLSVLARFVFYSGGMELVYIWLLYRLRRWWLQVHGGVVCPCRWFSFSVGFWFFCRMAVSFVLIISLHHLLVLVAPLAVSFRSFLGSAPHVVIRVANLSCMNSVLRIPAEKRGPSL